MTDPAPREWFLSRRERGNPATSFDRDSPGDVSWSEGNLVRPLVHGATYFRRLHDELCALEPGDRLFFTDWRGDADQRLLPDGPTVSEVLCDLAARKVQVRGLIWRSHSDRMQFSAQESAHLGEQANEAGAEVLLDQRVRRFGSHHQKLFVIRHENAPERDVAFVGGIDLCHGRRDDEQHLGDPQQQPMDKRYRGRAPWHDAMLELRGPVIGELLRTFVERWDDHTPLDRRTPYRMAMQRKAHMPRHPEELPDRFPDPPQAGPHTVQVLRTYGRKRPRFPFAPNGERSVARAYEKVFRRAQSFIYVEDQYLWSEDIARSIADALLRAPNLRLIAVVPRYPDADARFSGPPNRLGQIEAMQVLQEAAPDRVGIFDIENSEGTPIYVHAKVCIVDDVWFTCGSDNFNRRSWTTDSEITCAVIDSTYDEREPRDPAGQGDHARKLARDLRLQLWGEHLGRPSDDSELLDPAAGFEVWRSTASALDTWHDTGRHGPRPLGRARWHRPDPVTGVQRLWATPIYRLVYDPDGRSRQMRRAGTF